MTKFIYTRQGRTTSLGQYRFDSETPTEVDDARLIAKLTENPYFEAVDDGGEDDADRMALEEEAKRLGVKGPIGNMKDATLEAKIAGAKADGQD